MAATTTPRLNARLLLLLLLLLLRLVGQTTCPCCGRRRLRPRWNLFVLG